jgi:membrane-associated protease RseP (regulator of RpoE activity)
MTANETVHAVAVDTFPVQFDVGDGRSRALPVGVSARKLGNGANPGADLEEDKADALHQTLAAKNASKEWQRFVHEVAKDCGGESKMGWRGQESTIAKLIASTYAPLFKEKGLAVFFCHETSNVLGGVQRGVVGEAGYSFTYFWVEVADLSVNPSYVPLRAAITGDSVRMTVTKESQDTKVGITLHPLRDGQLVCTGVAPTSLAYDAGVRDGDVLLAINGQEVFASHYARGTSLIGQRSQITTMQEEVAAAIAMLRAAEGDVELAIRQRVAPELAHMFNELDRKKAQGPPEAGCCGLM